MLSTYHTARHDDKDAQAKHEEDADLLPGRDVKPQQQRHREHQDHQILEDLLNGQYQCHQVDIEARVRPKVAAPAQPDGLHGHALEDETALGDDGE